MSIVKFIQTGALMLVLCGAKAQPPMLPLPQVPVDKVQALKDTLTAMQLRADNEMFVNHCLWFKNVMDAQSQLTFHDSSVLSATYDTFCLNPVIGNCRSFNSYLKRERPLILSWVSPTDGEVSMAALILPADWDPEKTYPLYIHLHGLSSTTDLPIDYLTRYFLKPANTSFSYEDGYLLYPWGRGNLWYQGISETDIWESKENLEQLVNIEPERVYLKGHSMGGFGAWLIAGHSPETWAALGIEAGALWYDNSVLTTNFVQNLVDLPTYFVTGTYDGLLTVNQQAYNLLTQAGNNNTLFVTFEGAHEHLDVNEEPLYLWMKEFVNDDYNTTSGNKNTGQAFLKASPNPFITDITLEFDLQKNQPVQLLVYNAQGQLVDLLVDQILSSGKHQVKFSAKPQQSLYLFRLVVNHQASTCRVVRF